jgi:hypothetical protein
VGGVLCKPQCTLFFPHTKKYGNTTYNVSILSLVRSNAQLNSSSLNSDIRLHAMVKLSLKQTRIIMYKSNVHPILGPSLRPVSHHLQINLIWCNVPTSIWPTHSCHIWWKGQEVAWGHQPKGPTWRSMFRNWRYRNQI